jgi:hypothetical protein
MARQPAMVAALCVIAALVACSGDDDGGSDAADQAEPGGEQGALRRELLDMMEADQAERTGESDANGDESRADRLRGIIDEHS